MSFIIRKGTAGDLDMIERLYGEVCDHMAATVNYCAGSGTSTRPGRTRRRE